MKTKILICCVLLLLAGCGLGQQERNVDKSQELVVFAASSLTDAFSELAEAYELENPDVQVILNFASSSQLAAQLREGVSADLFASANPNQMQAVIDVGRIAEGTEELFVTNRLTIIVPADNPANIMALEDLARPGVQLILADEGVPVREYTDAVVTGMPVDFQKQFYSNMVSAEDNVRQVAAKVALGEADAGIVYTSDVTPDIVERIQQITLPEEQNVIAAYPIAPLVDAPSPELADSFIQFALSEEGQTVLAHWGFGRR